MKAQGVTVSAEASSLLNGAHMPEYRFSYTPNAQSKGLVPAKKGFRAQDAADAIAKKDEFIAK